MYKNALRVPHIFRFVVDAIKSFNCFCVGLLISDICEYLRTIKVN